ncbi:carbohydrate ABC transporter permease [Paenibacillus sp. SI8]|uniref:carbohydrate ABC transporter permease n=1 Tax=unclassified Paenibacillus TaxID=185978 RepID=UPI003465C166
MQQTKTSAFFSYGVVALLVLLYVLPLLILFNVSFKSLDEFVASPLSLTTSFHFSNYVSAWKEGKFSTLIGNSLLYTGVSTVFTVGLSLVAAFPVARKYVAWSGFLYMFFLASQFLPNPLVAQFKLMLTLNLYNTQLGYILLRTSGAGLIFMMFVGFIKSINRELDEAAGIDGCGYIRYMFQITLPLMKPIVATGVILTAIGTWNDLIVPTMYISDQTKWPITAGLINFQGQYGNNWPLLACGTMIVAGPLILLYVFIQRYIVDGAMAGAVKS